MKFTDVTWRSKIGSFGGGAKVKIRPHFITILYLGKLSFRNVMSVALIGILLMISGVEMNPGPVVRYLLVCNQDL